MFRLKSIRREIKETEEITAQRVVKRAEAKEKKMYQPAMLSGYKFEEPVKTKFLLQTSILRFLAGSGN